MNNPVIKAGHCWSSLWGSHCSGLLTLEELDVCTPSADRTRPTTPGFGWKMCKQNFRVTSRADEKTFSVHIALSHFSRECCVSCVVYRSTFILYPMILKAPTEKISPEGPFFFSCSLISSSEIYEKVSTLQKIFCLLALLAMVISTCSFTGRGCSSVRPDINLYCCHQKGHLSVKTQQTIDLSSNYFNQFLPA